MRFETSSRSPGQDPDQVPGPPPGQDPGPVPGSSSGGPGRFSVGAASDPPELGALSGILVRDYRALPSPARKLLLRIYRRLHKYLTGVHLSADPLVFVYCYKQLVRDVGYTESQLRLLLRLWYFSEEGKRVVDVRALGLTAWDKDYLKHFTLAGMFYRTSFDPAHPSSKLAVHRSNRKVFVTFTAKGARRAKKILKELRKMAADDLYNVLTYQEGEEKAARIMPQVLYMGEVRKKTQFKDLEEKRKKKGER